MSEQPSPPEGWYPVDDLSERYWNGNDWTDATRPRPSGQSGSQASRPVSSQSSRLAVAGVVTASLVGLLLSLQSASLLTGTGTIWTGAAIALGAVIFAFALRVRGWLKWVAVVVALVAITNAVYIETELEKQRQNIGQIGE